jgi:hypothetical protein
LFAKSRLWSAPGGFAKKFLPFFAKIFNDAISIRCFRVSDSDLIRAIDSRVVFAALPRVRARCGALRRAAPHFQKNQQSCFAVGGVTVIASAAKQSSV